MASPLTYSIGLFSLRNIFNWSYIHVSRNNSLPAQRCVPFMETRTETDLLICWPPPSFSSLILYGNKCRKTTFELVVSMCPQAAWNQDDNLALRCSWTSWHVHTVVWQRQANQPASQPCPVIDMVALFLSLAPQMTWDIVLLMWAGPDLCHEDHHHALWPSSEYTKIGCKFSVTE